MNKVPDLLSSIENVLAVKAKNMDNPTVDQDLGYLIFLATYYKYSNDETYKNKAVALFDTLLEVFPEKEMKVSLYEGFDGVAWTIDYLQRCGVIEVDDMMDDFEPHLFTSLSFDINTNNFDVLYGFIGKFQYFINSKQYDKPEVKELFLKAVNALYDSRIEDQNGIYWLEQDSADAISLGYAHGMPSILAFLTKLLEIGFDDAKILIMINGIVGTILAVKNKPLGISVFPDGFSKKHEANTFSRLAWCYGDLGICYALLYSSIILDRQDWKTEALIIKEKILNRGISESGLTHFSDYSFFDTGFCHGIAGISYFLYKINQLSGGDPAIEKKLLYWNGELIKNLEIQLAVEGDIYYPWQPNTPGEVYTVDKEFMLNGYSGTALVLLSLYYNKADWCDLFLIY